MIFVELCAGSAAVSLRWLSSKAKPPLSYQGGKRGYADAILRAMGQAPGAGRGHEIVLCEPGPWGEAWEHWRTAEGRADTAERLEAWAAEDPRTLWERLRRAPVPADVAERVATWAVLQFWSFGNKVVEPAGAGWNEHGFNKAAAYRREHHEARRAAGLKVYTGDQMRLDVQLLRAIRALPDRGSKYKTYEDSLLGAMARQLCISAEQKRPGCDRFAHGARLPPRGALFITDGVNKTSWGDVLFLRTLGKVARLDSQGGENTGE